MVYKIGFMTIQFKNAFEIVHKYSCFVSFESDYKLEMPNSKYSNRISEGKAKNCGISRNLSLKSNIRSNRWKLSSEWLGIFHKFGPKKRCFHENVLQNIEICFGKKTTTYCFHSCSVIYVRRWDHFMIMMI